MLLAETDFAPAKRLLIVPDSVLQYIPFPALFVDRGEKNVDPARYGEVVDIPSASALGILRKAREKSAPPTRVAAVLADPVFDQNDPRVPRTPNSGESTAAEQPLNLLIALRDTQGSRHIPRLPGSRDEARAIQQSLGRKKVFVALDFDASRSFVLRGGLQNYRFVHLAVHGIIDDVHPEMSGLILALVDRKGRRQDGYLRLGDIDKLQLSADLVVLSACNSALGRDLESEGIIGLPRGFLHAGARGVIAGLWKVDDEATAEFMKYLYVRLQAGEKSSAALRGAQIEMSRSARWSAPFYWAGFVLQGDYK
jgi:CHAT domain-containing protein